MNNIIFKINFYIILFVIFGKIFSNSNDTSILDFDITTYESYPFKEKYLKFKPSFNFDGKLSNHKNTEYPLDKNFMNDGLVSLLLFRKSWEDTEFKQKESWWDVTASYDYERNKYNRKIYYDYFQLTEIFGEKSKKNFNLDCYYRNSIRKYTQRRNFFELYIRTFFVADIPYIEEGISERTSENYYDSAYYYFDRHYSRTKYYRFILFPDLIFYFGIFRDGGSLIHYHCR